MRYGMLALWMLLPAWIGCAHHASTTAVPMSPWNQGTPDGMPFYLPKPLLVIAKNVRHIDEAKIGLTNPAPIPNAFDNQASYGDIKANVTSPGSGDAAGLKATSETDGINLPEKFSPAIPAFESNKERLIPSERIQDGLTPDSFFTYQIVFVPDLSQKYGLKITGKPGEVRAAMNLVNGWMYTGMGPYYLKDSSTAQNWMAVGVATMFAGRGASQVLGEVSGIAGMSGSGGKSERGAANDQDVIDRFTRLAEALKQEEAVPQQMCHYAEVYIYEPTLTPHGKTDWKLVAHHDFTRDYFLPQANKELLDQLIPEIIGLPKAAVPMQPSKPGSSFESPETGSSGQPNSPSPLPPPANELRPPVIRPNPSAVPPDPASIPPDPASIPRPTAQHFSDS